MRSSVSLICALLAFSPCYLLSHVASAEPPKGTQQPAVPPASSTPPQGESPASPPSGGKDAGGSDAKPETRPETKPETRPETKPETKPETQSTTRPAPKPATVPGPNDVLHAAAQKDLPRRTYTIFGESFDCELCLQPTSRDIGMAARTEFPEGTAMIFVHPRPRMLNYWMKDCLIDMDIVMVDRNGVVGALHEAVREKLRTKDESLADYQARLPLYGTPTPAKYVIELPPGTIARLKPKVGQRIDIDWKPLDAIAK
jgi:uncharacterized membrane protein (UPF0127 family)